MILKIFLIFYNVLIRMHVYGSKTNNESHSSILIYYILHIDATKMYMSNKLPNFTP